MICSGGDHAVEEDDMVRNCTAGAPLKPCCSAVCGLPRRELGASHALKYHENVRRGCFGGPARVWPRGVGFTAPDLTGRAPCSRGPWNPRGVQKCTGEHARNVSAGGENGEKVMMFTLHTPLFSAAFNTLGSNTENNLAETSPHRTDQRQEEKEARR